MIDTKELRMLAQEFKLAGSPMFLQTTQMNELLDRLEATEKERDAAELMSLALRAKVEQLTEAEAVMRRNAFEYQAEAERLRAKVEAMEKQEPVAIQHRVPSVDFRGECVGYSEWRDGTGLEHWPRRTLYALPGAKGEMK